LFNPTIEALKKLGGSAAVTELEDKVASLLNLSESDINEIHKGNRTKFGYRLAWARSYLKRCGLIDNSARGVWSLTNKGQKATTVNQDEIKRTARKLQLLEATKSATEENAIEEETLPDWEKELLNIIQNMNPEAFERLTQRFLRESRFVQVDITGRPHDQGIDGKGIMRLGLLSFHVHFQCKKYSGSVSAAEIRNFRGAMVGRADKGLFITTGVFTHDAKKEAKREGASPIDLIDGSELAHQLKDLGLGVTKKSVEQITVDKAWFDGI
jgi:restriction system protein